MGGVFNACFRRSLRSRRIPLEGSSMQFLTHRDETLPAQTPSHTVKFFLVYRVEDSSESIWSASGSIEIGECPFTGDSHVHFVAEDLTSNIRSITLSRVGYPSLQIVWDSILTSSLPSPRSTSLTWIVPLSESLGIPRYQLMTSRIMLRSYTISHIVVPTDHAILV